MSNIINLKEKEVPMQKPSRILDAESVGKKQVKKPEPIKQKKTPVLKESKTHLEWTTPEFEYYKNSQSWFITIGVIAGILLIIAIFTKNFLFGLLIGISYFLITTYSLKKPDNVKLSISPKGVKINNTLYEFENLRSFWIFYDLPEIKELSLRSKKTIMPYVRVPIGDENPVEIRKILIKYLPEKKHKESAIDNLARNLKF